jgi:hypothetical protein
MAAEQIGINSNEQPEPHNEDEYREEVHQEISISEAFLKEEHSDPPSLTTERESRGFMSAEYAKLTLARLCPGEKQLPL